MLLAVTFTEFILRVNVILGIILSMLGIAVAILARRLSQVIERTGEINRVSKTYLWTKVIGLTMLLVGMVLIAWPV